MDMHPQLQIQPRRSGRFSAQLEFRRGLRDARQGRAPASMAEAYVAGYAQGRRAPRLRAPQAAAAGAEPPSGPSPTAASPALAA